MNRGLRARLSASFQGDTVRWRSDAPLDLRGPLRSESASELYFLRNSTAGILGGDHFEIDISACAGANVQVATPSSTKVYAMEDGASSSVQLSASTGSRLVWGPQPLILQQGADFTQLTSAHLNSGSIVLAEAVAMGRLAAGESLRFRRFENVLRVLSAEGDELYEEHYVLSPHDDASIETALGGLGAMGSLYVLGPSEPGAQDSLAALVEEAGVFGGVSTLPNDAGVVVRLLAANLSLVVAFLQEAVRGVVNGWEADKRMASVPERHVVR